MTSRIGIAAGNEVRRRIAERGIACQLSEDGYQFAVHEPRTSIMRRKRWKH